MTPAAPRRHKHHEAEPANGMIAHLPVGNEVRARRVLPSWIGVSGRFCCSIPSALRATPRYAPFCPFLPSVPSQNMETKSPTRRGTSRHSPDLHTASPHSCPPFRWTHPSRGQVVAGDEFHIANSGPPELGRGRLGESGSMSQICGSVFSGVLMISYVYQMLAW